MYSEDGFITYETLAAYLNTVAEEVSESFVNAMALIGLTPDIFKVDPEDDSKGYKDEGVRSVLLDLLRQCV